MGQMKQFFLFFSKYWITQLEESEEVHHQWGINGMKSRKAALIMTWHTSMIARG